MGFRAAHSQSKAHGTKLQLEPGSGPPWKEEGKESQNETGPDGCCMCNWEVFAGNACYLQVAYGFKTLFILAFSIKYPEPKRAFKSLPGPTNFMALIQDRSAEPATQVPACRCPKNVRKHGHSSLMLRTHCYSDTLPQKMAASRNAQQPKPSEPSNGCESSLSWDELQQDFCEP